MILLLALFGAASLYLLIDYYWKKINDREDEE